MTDDEALKLDKQIIILGYATEILAKNLCGSDWATVQNAAYTAAEAQYAAKFPLNLPSK